MSLALVILIVVGIVLLTAFYVAAEISIAGSRRSRMQQLHDEGHALAGLVLDIIEQPSRLSAYISTCQISITICSIALGFVGQGWLAYRLEPIVLRLGGNPATASSVSVAVILAVLSLAQVFFGELIPKNIGVRLPEQLGMATVRPLMVYHLLFTPFLYVFNLANNAILRLLRMQVSHEHGLVLTPEEIRRLASESRAQGSIQREEHEWIDSTLRIDEMQIGHIMTPRRRIFAAPATLAVSDWTRLLIGSPYSRMPLFGLTLDDMQGVVHLLDLMCWEEDSAPRADLIHPLPSLPHTMAVDEGLRWMQQRRIHMVRVAGPEGTTLGIATLEELVEAVVGDIEDEFDTEQPPAYWFQDQGRLRIDARIPAENLARFLGCPVPTVRRLLHELTPDPAARRPAPGARRRAMPGQTAVSYTDPHTGRTLMLVVEERQDQRVISYSVPFEPSMLDRMPYLRLAA